MTQHQPPKKKQRRGPKPLDPATKRMHTVSVRLNAEELERLDQKRKVSSMQRGEWLRAAALHRLPPSIPELNREAWAVLARSAGNLNQLARTLNEGAGVNLTEIKTLLADLRRSLIGARLDDESEG